MRRLYLLRHGKSDWSADFATDHERPLAARGRRAAGTVGRFLASIGQAPQLAVTSTAVRARTTVEIAATAGGWRCPIERTERLYGHSSEEVLAVVRQTGDEVERLLLAGHQPVWSEIAARLIGGGSVKLVTASLARIDLGVDRWQDARWGSGTLAWLVTPKLLQGFGG